MVGAHAGLGIAFVTLSPWSLAFCVYRSSKGIQQEEDQQSKGQKLQCTVNGSNWSTSPSLCVAPNFLQLFLFIFFFLSSMTTSFVAFLNVLSSFGVLFVSGWKVRNQLMFQHPTMPQYAQLSRNWPPLSKGERLFRYTQAFSCNWSYCILLSWAPALSQAQDVFLARDERTVWNSCFKTWENAKSTQLACVDSWDVNTDK